MILVRHEGRVVAIVRPPVIEFPCRIVALEPDHPHRRWAFCLGLFALEVAEGRISGVYTDARAALFARQALIPDEEFADLASLDEAILAEHFNVPLSAIADKRADLEELPCW